MLLSQTSDTPKKRVAAAPTIRDVAAMAGVSITTVSRVLNNKADVATETAQRVQSAIDALHFHTNMAARSMRSRHKEVIGIIVPDTEHTYGVEVLKAAGHAIAATEYELIAMTTGTTIPKRRELWEQQQVSRVNGVLTDGVVVVVPTLPEYRTTFPLIVVDPCDGATAHPSVSADNYGGAITAMRYLIELGHRRIGHVGGKKVSRSTGERLRAYYDALTEAGIPIDESLVLPGEFSVSSGVAAMRTYHSYAEPPTAVFAANDDSALGLMSEARALGLSVPQDLSIIGFDDVPAAETSHPGLTTVNQNLYETIRVAFTMLIDLANGKPLEQHNVLIPTRLIIRESCAPCIAR